jgi:hypothetical protein
MAKLGQGFLGNAKGKLGTVVFAKNRKTNTVRKHQPIIQDKKSPAQLTQRQAMKVITSALSPLKDSFIAFFNQSADNKQTPWAKAIKDNINALDVNGNFDLSKLKLGNPVIPAPIIKSVIFNPFIDQIKIDLSANYYSTSSINLISFIGQYKNINSQYLYDTRNLIMFHWLHLGYCYESMGGGEENTYINLYIGGTIICLLGFAGE